MSVLIVSPVPVEVGGISGFSERYFRFIEAVARRHDVVDLVEIGPEAGQSQDDHPSVRSHERVDVTLGDPRVVLSRYPYGCQYFARVRFPRRVTDVAVFLLPWTAPLASSVDAARVVFAPEETFDRFSAHAAARIPSLPKRSLVSAIEATRWRMLYRLARRGDAIVAISSKERQKLSRHLPSGRLHVFPHGVDCDRFAPARTDKDIDVLVVGDFRRNDGAGVVLANELDSKGIRATLVGIGSEVLDLPSSSIGVGRVVDVAPYYKRARTVAVPAQFSTGVKTTTLQAMASGCATVASPAGASGVEATAGTDFIVADSIEGIVDELVRLLDDDTVRVRLGAAGRRAIVRNHDLRSVSDAFGALVSATWRGGPTRSEG